MPGAGSDLFADSAYPRDGKMHLLNTIPNGENSRTILQTALDTGAPFRIGIAAHLYANTFSHQNFLGYKDGFNSLIPLSPFNIGHAEAFHKPDYVAAVWHDTRLVLSKERADNKWRFLQAVAEKAPDPLPAPDYPRPAPTFTWNVATKAPTGISFSSQ
jgi:hypothetical protein